jgi:hypothetical protein
VDLNHGPTGLQPVALPLSYVSSHCIACCLRLRQMSPAGLEPARSKAWGLEAHSLDQLGHSDDTVHSFARCRDGRAHHPVASPGNRTPGARLETSYVTTTPVRLFVMCCLRLRLVVVRVRAACASGSLLFVCVLPAPQARCCSCACCLRLRLVGPPRNRTPDLLLPKQPSYH